MQHYLNSLKNNRIRLDKSIIAVYSVVIEANKDKSKSLQILKTAKKCNCSTSRVYKALQLNALRQTGSAGEQPVGV